MPIRIPAPACALSALLLAAPSFVYAQSAVAQAEPAATESGDTAAVALTVPGPAVAAAEQTAPRAAERRRRRPSMVGYIEDSTVQTQIRFRFDIGRGNNVPDRAEFFYAKCGCYNFVPPPAFDREAPGPGPGIPAELNYREFYAYAERALNERYSVFGELPLRGLSPESWLPTGLAEWEGQTGIGDLRFGGKASLFNDGDRTVTALVRVAVPTGDAGKGLGTNHASIEPALLFHSSVADRVGIEAQVGYWKSLGGSAGVNSNDNFSGDVLSWGIGPSFDVYSSDRVRFAPIVELVGWRVISGFQTCANCDADAGGTNIVNLKVGARATVRDRHSFYGGIGWHLTDDTWYDKLFRFEYRLGL